MFSLFNILSRNNTHTFLLSYIVSPFPLSRMHVDLEGGAGTFVQAQVADTQLMSDAESEDRASTVNDGEAFGKDAGVGDGGVFEENAVDDGGADADLCDSM